MTDAADAHVQHCRVDTHLQCIGAIELNGDLRFDALLDVQAFNNGKQMAHSGMNASALYLFDRLFSLAKVWVSTP